MIKNVIVYGKNCGLQKKAVAELTRIILDYTFVYPVCVSTDDFKREEDTRYYFIGTASDNSYLKKIYVPDKEEGYTIKVDDGDVYIAGYDDAGVFYGCLDFYNKYVVTHEYNNDPGVYLINIFDGKFADFELSSSPSVKNRGIWTWGHVIYDYKGFVENMAKLKMNTVIIWNDFVPFNAKELVEYAHSFNIKVIWGFSWFWDVDCAKFNLETVHNKIPEIIEKYEKEYADLKADGIYFQSFTELSQEKIGDILIAEAVTNIVNETADRLWQKYPDVELQFGLHAMSVREKLEYIKNVNPKIRIVWEDCGAFPFSYLPTDIKEFDKTADFASEILKLRGEDDKFGVVTKGFTKLDWDAFVHLEGAQCIGVSSEAMQRNRMIRKEKIWRYIQAGWSVNAPKAYEMIQLMCNEKKGNLDITALVEDGMFEKKIYYPVVLYSEMLWNCNGDIKNMMYETALREYAEYV